MVAEESKVPETKRRALESLRFKLANSLITPEAFQVPFGKQVNMSLHYCYMSIVFMFPRVQDDKSLMGLVGALSLRMC